MGDIADMMIEGFLDEVTGEIIDGTAPGYPRSRYYKSRNRKTDGDFRCEKCRKYFKTESAVADHTRDMHTVEGQTRRRKLRSIEKNK